MTKYKKNILYIDIETCSLYSDFYKLSDREKMLWAAKCKTFIKSYDDFEGQKTVLTELYKSKAGIYAEFAKVLCISVAFISTENNEEKLIIFSFCNSNESLVLQSFAYFLTQHPELKYFCGHNIREFDIPFLARRYSIAGIPIPYMINLRGKKPWEIKHLLDTMELWKFGDYKNYTSLQLLAAIFNLDDPKQNISGADVHDVFWGEKDLDRIKIYCEQDVKTVFQLYNRMCPEFSDESLEMHYAIYS